MDDKPKPELRHNNHNFRDRMKNQANGFERFKAQMKANAAEMIEASRGIDWQETNEIMKRYRATRDDPENPKSKIWETAISDKTPREASLFWRYLPDPLKRRGRPKGGMLVAEEALFDEMTARMEATGKHRKTVARELIQERGGVHHAELENRVNYVARLHGKRVKK
ncbi:hypothetical protein IMCC20628_01850 [Hoeflea sp. IMCC20628]|uniref:hypothetical protein n=1 Tax=Hoeflea sp. IMCC20628 TaxID=1620421 RepID=UPI00063AB5AC|nr:hypothetical protein [Hoeflea sp. IMCC20628]AKI00557.1 hypothetical protein IMCC20628_01850 [Hoeflea sp. IMCC20628]